jgi:hypothetical protein
MRTLASSRAEVARETIKGSKSRDATNASYRNRVTVVVPPFWAKAGVTKAIRRLGIVDGEFVTAVIVEGLLRCRRTRNRDRRAPDRSPQESSSWESFRLDSFIRYFVIALPT